MNKLNIPLTPICRGSVLLIAFTLLLVSGPAHSQTITKAVSTNTQPRKTNMKGFKTNIQQDALVNKDFRNVLYTAKHLQLVLMTLKPGEDIGLETHPTIDQFFRFESGHGKCIIDGHEYDIKAGDAIIVPAGARHNVINVDKGAELKMYTIYAAPNHKDGLVRATKKEADTYGVKFDGKTTE